MVSESDKLTDKQGQALVDLARKTLMEHFGRKADNGKQLADFLKTPVMQKTCGTFVTLKIGKQLRGCIGSLEGDKSLVDDIAENALKAALKDPRFRPLNNRELDCVSIEVSILTRPHALEYTDGDDLKRKLRPNVDGVIIRKGLAGATFLPQVWKQLPEPEQFLSHLCLKAGLDKNAWRKSELAIQTYHVQYFQE
ncbi:MAG: AmmeMemoRadiSam system protein A [Desulfobacteraceae bacterium]|nr:AmmeMemoRadiSam system protein A [Desulfobacteraceae bacterium]